jgi:diguanylate cyclase (GGDEF)-like protein
MSVSNGIAPTAKTSSQSTVITSDDFNHILIETLIHVCQLSQSTSSIANDLFAQILQLGYANPNQVIFKLKLKKILAQLKTQCRTNQFDEQTQVEYLDSMHGRIAEFESEFTYANELTQQSSQHRSEFSQQLSSSITEISDDVAEAESLVDIKSQVSAYLEQIKVDVKNQSDKEALASSQLAGLLATMQSQLTNLQQQTLAYSAALKQKDKLAQTDSLTGLPNRQGCDYALRKIQQTQPQPVCIGILDIDHFKKINDNFGHIAGDKVLQLVARFIQNNMDDNFFIGRWGGEEFLLIIQHQTVEVAYTNLAKLLVKISKLPIQYKEQNIPLTASIGVTELPLDTDVTDAFDKADVALYYAKQHGRNQVQIGK